MKKILSVVLLSAMLVAALASCGGGETENTTPAATTSAAKTTPKQTAFSTEPPEDGEDQQPTPPIVAGAGLEQLLDGKIRLSDADSTVKVNMESLVSIGFTPWQTYESIAELFDGIDTEQEWFYDPDENGDLTILKSGADPTNTDASRRGGGPGKIGGTLDAVNGGYFFFALTDKATLGAYVITTGNDNALYTDRNPVEWTLYGTNDADLYATASGGAAFDPEAWSKLDFVYDGQLVEDNFYPNGYEIDADKQGAYQYYVWHLSYTRANQFQALEFDLYAIAD